MSREEVVEYYRKHFVVDSYERKRFFTIGGKLVDRKEKDIVSKFAVHTCEDLENDWILDLGTGTGRIAAWFKSKKKIGVDSSITMLKEARKKGLEVIYCDMQHLPFRDGTFSTAVAIRVFIRISSLMPFFKEIARVSREGGRFIFDTSNRFGIGYIFRRFTQEPSHVTLPKKEVQKCLKLASFNILRIEPHFIIPRGIYQKINGIFVRVLWQIDNILLKTILRRIASTFFWKARMIRKF